MKSRMQSGSGKTSMLLAALLTMGVAGMPVNAADSTPTAQATAAVDSDFKRLDSNQDGYLSLEEFKAMGKDDLAFRAADINGDGRLDSEEFARHLAAKASDRSESEAGRMKPVEPTAPSPGQSPGGAY